MLAGKAREAFLALSVADSKVRATIKSAGLKTCELVPEAYRQCSQFTIKLDTQTYSEFVCGLISAFNHWSTASQAATFEVLCNLIVLEQFKNVATEAVVAYISERKIRSPGEAAALADECVLTHKHFEPNMVVHL